MLGLIGSQRLAREVRSDSLAESKVMAINSREQPYFQSLYVTPALMLCELIMNEY